MTMQNTTTATPFWLSGNWSPTQIESTEFDLDVEGALPRELNGRYVRTGPNPVNGVSQHAFLGYGPQKQLALDRTTHRWVLLLDADEALAEDAPAATREARGPCLSSCGPRGPPGPTR